MGTSRKARGEGTAKQAAAELDRNVKRVVIEDGPHAGCSWSGAPSALTLHLAWGFTAYDYRRTARTDDGTGYYRLVRTEEVAGDG